jgi:hypothetical protein
MNQLQFDPEYLEFVKERIPVMNDLELQQAVLDYCKNYSKNNSSNRLKNIKENCLSKIKARLESQELLKNNINNKNGIKKNSNNYTFISNDPNNNSKLIKVTVKDNLPGFTTPIHFPFIEALINVTLFYYSKKEHSINYNKKSENSNNNSVNSNKTVNINSIIDCTFNKTKTGFLYQEMNKVKSPTLFEFIINLYKNNSLNNTDKNKILFKVLLKIAKELYILQNVCGFIHGDFHTGNILVEYNSNVDIKITFIDFGYSVVKLPMINNNNSENYILSSPVSVNLKKEMNLYKIPRLRNIDLFHLFRDFYSFFYSETNNNNFNSYYEKNKNKIELKINKNYQDFMDKLFIIVFSNITNNNYITRPEPHKFSRNNTFIRLNLDMLNPGNFITLKLSNINSIKVPSNSTNKI